MAETKTSPPSLAAYRPSCRFLLAVLFLASGSACVHLDARPEPLGSPFEVFQDNQLGDDYSLERVDYQLDGVPLRTWRSSGRNDRGAPSGSVYETTLSAGLKKFVARATVTVRGRAGEEFTVSVAHVEPIVAVSGQRTRVVFLLCPSERRNRVGAVMTQVEASQMTIGATRAPYLRAKCMTFADPPSPGVDDESTGVPP